MTPTRSEFRGLLDSVNQLDARRARIEELRQKYFDALQADDAARQTQAIEDAAREGVELLQHLPLSELREVEQIKKLANKLAEYKGVLDDGKTLVVLKDLNVDDLLRKLSDLQRVTQDLKATLSASNRVESEAESLQRDLANVATSLERGSDGLKNLVGRVGDWLVYARIHDTLLKLDVASLRDYVQFAARWLDDASDTLRGLSDSSDARPALDGLIAGAKMQQEEMARLLSDDTVKARLNQIEDAMDHDQALAVKDIQWLQQLAQGFPNLPAPMIRLLARADQAAPAKSAGFGELSVKCWGEWRRFAEMAENSNLAQKQASLTDIDKNLAEWKSRVALVGADHEGWYLWRTRVGQAQEMAESLKPFLAEPGGAAFRGEPEYDTAWRMLGRWLEQAPDEVFCLLAVEWLTAHQILCGWDEALIAQHISKLPKKQQAVRIEEMRAGLKPYQNRERERAEAKRARGLTLVRQMSDHSAAAQKSSPGRPEEPPSQDRASGAPSNPGSSLGAGSYGPYPTARNADSQYRGGA